MMNLESIIAKIKNSFHIKQIKIKRNKTLTVNSFTTIITFSFFLWLIILTVQGLIFFYYSQFCYTNLKLIYNSSCVQMKSGDISRQIYESEKLLDLELILRGISQCNDMNKVYYYITLYLLKMSLSPGTWPNQGCSSTDTSASLTASHESSLPGAMTAWLLMLGRC